MARQDSMDTKPTSLSPASASQTRSTVKATPIAPTTTSTTTRTGTADVRERSAFRGASWKPRRLELDGEALSIINPTSSKRTRVPLSTVIGVERTDLAAHALAVRLLSTAARNGKTTTLALSFASDSALYDWQDDIYARSPLGQYTSGPFDFVHKAHVGADVTGNFGDANILPIYAEIIGGGSTQPAALVAQTPRSRPVSGIVVLPKSNSNSSHNHSPTNNNSSSPVNTHANATPSPPTSAISTGKAPALEGRYVVRQETDGMLARWLAKARWVAFRDASVVVHRGADKASPLDRTIAVSHISRVAPDPARPNVLALEVQGKDKAKETVRVVFAQAQDAVVWAAAVKAERERVDKARMKEMEKAIKEEKQKQKEARRQSKGEKRRSVPLAAPVGA